MPDDLRTRILDAALDHVPFDGWSDETLQAAAADAGVDVAIGFDAGDVPGAELSHPEVACSFDAVIKRFSLSSPVLDRVASIVRAADGNALETEPQAAGLLAISLGLSRMYKDDLAQLDAGLLIYDALYRWARDAAFETHTWDAHEGGS